MYEVLNLFFFFFCACGIYLDHKPQGFKLVQQGYGSQEEIGYTVGSIAVEGRLCLDVQDVQGWEALI